MTDIDAITLEAHLTDEVAERGIESAVKGRHAAARKYVKWVRRRHPDATPEEIVRLLERHYMVAISVAGGVVAAGSLALTVATAKRPGLSLARKGVQRVSKMLPAGDEQLQFEITALFAFALADIHGMTLDQSQAHALVFGLSNGKLDQEQVAAMAANLAQSSAVSTPLGGTGVALVKNSTHWAHTLADLLPAGAAKELVRGVQTGRLGDVGGKLSTKQQKALEYGVGALAGGVTLFIFGRGVVDATRQAFAAAPDRFPAHLAIEIKDESEKDDPPSRAMAALKDASHSVGQWMKTVGTATGGVTRLFRGEDRDGDGIPDEPPALTAVKGLGGTITNAAGNVVGKVAAPFKRKGSADSAPSAEGTG